LATFGEVEGVLALYLGWVGIQGKPSPFHFDVVQAFNGDHIHEGLRWRETDFSWSSQQVIPLS
jgi:hypothetical protein